MLIIVFNVLPFNPTAHRTSWLYKHEIWFGSRFFSFSCLVNIGLVPWWGAIIINVNRLIYSNRTLSKNLSAFYVMLERDPNNTHEDNFMMSFRHACWEF